jgi:NADPH:quinone reductase-like Zn-dependent oxidoreductase
MMSTPSRLLPLIALFACVSQTWAAGAPNACSKAPAQMRAARVHAAGGPEALRIEPVPTPVPAAGEVLVRVHHASINPIDWKLQKAGRLPMPAIPGADFAGEVIGLGSGASGFKCGDLVAGVMNQRERAGSYAEYLTVPVSEIVRKPASFSTAEAAAYPTVAVAAWRYVVQAAAVGSGERVLVHGGAGGSGSVIVQLAKARGAYVIATASAQNHKFLKEIGADEVIDYRTTRFEDVVRNVDVVVDTVGGDTLSRSVTVLRDGGRLVTLVGSVPKYIGSVPPEVCALGRGRIVCPTTPPWDVKLGLESMEPLITAGKVRIHIEKTYPLAQIAEAQQHNIGGHTRGKVVVDMGVPKGNHE